MKVNLVVAGLLAAAIYSGNAFAKANSELNGLWILDAAATEQLYLGSSRPLTNGAREFGGAHWVCLISHQFSEDTVIRDAYGGGGKKAEFRLSSEDGSKLTYTQTDATAGQKPIILSMSILKGGGLEIVEPIMGLPTIWKKSQVTSERVTKGDVTAACNAWINSMQRIINFLKAKPN